VIVPDVVVWAVVAICFAIPAAAGTIVRVGIARRLNHGWFPLGTFAVNCTGAFLLGLLTSSAWGGDYAEILIGVAALGSLTTFSTVAWETLSLAVANQKLRATVYLGVTLLAGIGAAWVGLELGLAIGD